MPLEPLTPTGVDNKQLELYALPDALLHVEANQARTDFKVWMNANFDMTPAQAAYLDTLPQVFLDRISCDVAIALWFRLQIIFQQLGTVGASKLVRTSPSLEVTYNPSLPGEGVDAIGMLTVTVEYLP